MNNLTDEQEQGFVKFLEKWSGIEFRGYFYDTALTLGINKYCLNDLTYIQIYICLHKAREGINKDLEEKGLFDILLDNNVIHLTKYNSQESNFTQSFNHRDYDNLEIKALEECLKVIFLMGIK